MSKRARIKLLCVGFILFVPLITAFIFLMSVRNEFVKYLETKYTEHTFKVGFSKVDILYDKYYSKAVCLEDGTSFPISKSFNTKDIHEDYPQTKSQDQYNSKIKNIVSGSDIQKDIRGITGSGKKLFENDAPYEQINIFLDTEADHILVTKKAMDILKNKNIAAERIIFTYEKDKGAYEIWLSSNDYNLTEKEIEAKVKRMK